MNEAKIKLPIIVEEQQPINEEKELISFNVSNNFEEVISFIELTIINSFLYKTYLNKTNKEIFVGGYGGVTRNRINYSTVFDATSSHWFSIKFENDENEFIVQTIMMIDETTNRFYTTLSITSKQISEIKFSELFNKLKKISFENSEYKNKCIKISVLENTFRGIEIIEIEDKKSNLCLSEAQDRFKNHFINVVKRNGSVRYLFNGEPGTGKAQPLDAKILTPSGWKTMGEINAGDYVMTPFGKPSKVVNVYPQGEKDIFRIKTKDGRQTEACGEHLWKIYGLPNFRNNGEPTRIINTIEIKNKLTETKYNIKLPLVNKEINTEDDFNKKIQFIRDTFKNDATLNSFSDIFYETLSYDLAKKIQDIIWSIGGLCTINVKFVDPLIYSLKIIYKEPQIFFNELTNIKIRSRKKEIRNDIETIEYVGVKEAKCIMIEDENHLYVTDDYIVTHNTETIRDIMRSLKNEVTFIIPDFYTHSDLETIMNATTIFDKSVVIMDDVDLHIGSRETGSYTRLLGQFLSFFDGVKKNKLSLLASTNDKSLVDKAAERPGRFNLTIDYGFLDKQQIIKLCELYIPKKFLSKEVIDCLTSKINGKDLKITGAFIYNLGENIKEMSLDSEWTLNDTLSLIKESYKGFYSSQLEKEKTSIGF